jgi:hypothetical protein
METFEFKGTFYIIPRMKYEIKELYIERVWHILNNKKSEKIDLSESIIWSNKKNLKCDYK